MSVSSISLASTSLSNPSYRRHVGDSTRADRMSPRQAEPQRVDDDSTGATDTRGPRNPLVAAMLQAMQGLVSSTPATETAAAPATDADTTMRTAPTTTTTDDASSLKEAAVAFAHELFGALRELGGRAHGEGRHGWRHDHPRGGDGYGNLAQRLERLATRLEGSSGTVDSAPTPTPLPAGTTDPVVQATPEPTPAPTPAPIEDTAAPVVDSTTPATGATLPATSTPVSLPAVADGDIHITININLGGNANTSSGPLDKLKSAFEQLFKALQPASAESSSGADGASSKLVTFLRSMAQSLRSSGDTAAASTPTRGGLVNLVA